MRALANYGESFARYSVTDRQGVFETKDAAMSVQVQLRCTDNPGLSRVKENAMTRMFWIVCMSALVLTSAASGGPVVEHGESALADDDYWERGLDVNACYGFEPAPGMRKPDDCPDKVMMQGFPFYISQGLPSDAEMSRPTLHRDLAPRDGAVEDSS